MLEIGVPVKLRGEKTGEFVFVVQKRYYHKGPGHEMIKKRIHNKIKQDPRIMERIQNMNPDVKKCWQDMMRGGSIERDACERPEMLRMRR